MSQYNEEWAERMHAALEDADKNLEEFRGFNHLIGAMMSASDDVKSDTYLRTIIRALTWRMICELKKIDDARAAIEYGLRLPEAEEAEDAL